MCTVGNLWISAVTLGTVMRFVPAKTKWTRIQHDWWVWWNLGMNSSSNLLCWSTMHKCNLWSWHMAHVRPLKWPSDPVTSNKVKLPQSMLSLATPFWDLPWWLWSLNTITVNCSSTHFAWKTSGPPTQNAAEAPYWQTSTRSLATGYSQHWKQMGNP